MSAPKTAKEDGVSENNAGSGALQEALLPTLDKSFSPRPEPQDKLLIFLASAAHEDNCLTHQAWQAASAILPEIFGKGESSFSVFQSKFHAALLSPPVPPAAFINEAGLARDFSALPESAQAKYRGAVRSLSFEYAHVLDELLKKSGVPSPASPADDGEPAGEGTLTVMENGIAGRQGRSPAAVRMQRQIASAAKSFFADEPPSAAMQDLDLRHISYGRSRRQSTPAQKTILEAREVALSLNSAELYLQCEDSFRLLRDQPLTVAILGEARTGKSSLANALLGRAASPVREAMATTSALVNFRRGDSFRYKITYAENHGAKQPEGFRDIAFSALFSQAAADDGRWTYSESRLTDLILNNDGEGGKCAAILDVELPSPLLDQGLVLADTPGLNHPSSMQSGLALHAGFNADCILFVMDAGMPRSSAGEECLRSIAAKGRATHVIGVLTNMDRLAEQQSRSNALKAAQGMMAEAASAGLEPLGLFSIHAGHAMEARCKTHVPPSGDDFAKLLDAISSLCRSQEKLQAARNERLARRSSDFAVLAQEESKKFCQKEIAALPDAQHIAFLKQHRDQLRKIFERTIAQGRSVISAADVDIETWRKAQVQDLDAWEEGAVLRVMTAIREKADSLGSPAMFNRKNWQEFDSETMPGLEEGTVQDILEKRNESLRDWNQKLRSFDGALREISTACLENVLVEGEKLAAHGGGMSESHAQLLVRASSIARNLGMMGSGAVLGSLGGAGIGIGAVLAGIGWWALVPVAFASGLYALIRHFGNPDRCRRIYLRKREEAVRDWAARQKARLKEVFEKTSEEVVEAYRQAAEKSFLPAATMLAEEEASLSLYLGILDRMRSDAEKKAAAATALAASLARQIESKAR